MNIKKEFPWFKNNPGFFYFDSSATTLKPQSVIDRIRNYYEKEGTNPHNTDSDFTMHVANEVEEARKTIANFINAETNEIAFTSGATESLNLAANGIKNLLHKDDEVILTYGEHGSNLLPWMKLVDEIGIKIVFVGEKFQVTKPEDYLKVLTNKTKVVAFANGHNLTGRIFDARKVTEIIKKYNENIFVVIDATQSLAHHPIDVKQIRCDFLACSAHKLFGPTGVGAIYIKKEIQDQIDPLRYGGDMNHQIYEDGYSLRNDIAKYEGGTQNVAGILGWKVAIDFINEIGYNKIESHELELGKYAREQLAKIPNLIIYNIEDESATISFNYDGVFCQDLANWLGKQKIIVRSGLSCAKLYCNLIDTKALIRVSLSIYNTKKDIDYLCETLKKFKKGDEINVLF